MQSDLIGLANPAMVPECVRSDQTVFTWPPPHILACESSENHGGVKDASTFLSTWKLLDEIVFTRRQSLTLYLIRQVTLCVSSVIVVEAGWAGPDFLTKDLRKI